MLPSFYTYSSSCSLIFSSHILFHHSLLSCLLSLLFIFRMLLPITLYPSIICSFIFSPYYPFTITAIAPPLFAGCITASYLLFSSLIPHLSFYFKLYFRFPLALFTIGIIFLVILSLSSSYFLSLYNMSSTQIKTSSFFHPYFHSLRSSPRLKILFLGHSVSHFLLS